MQDLFAPEPQPTPTMPDNARIVGVVVNSNLWRVFDYAWGPHLGEPFLGQRVQVPFGKKDKPTTAYLADIGPRPPGAQGRQIKTVAGRIDDVPLLDEPLWKLATWISEYYLTPLGMVLAAMIPSAVGRHAPKTEKVAFLTATDTKWPARLGLRQKTILDELLEARKQGVEPLSVEQLIRHSRGSQITIRRLLELGMIRVESRPVTLPQLEGDAEANPFDLNEEQKAALATLEPKLVGGFSATLLHGVTGSGKTEVYVQAIRKVVAAGRQAIVLAPEIALATQTLQRLIKRLPRVAVLHSGLTSAQRAFYYQQIHDGTAAVVIGPRSAIFAPARKLGLIIVDEEHEPTYKQDNAPRYHARDTAVMRASLAGVPVILGSATPSLESLHNATQGRYGLVRLTGRVRNLPMPKLQIVHLRQEMQPGRVELIGQTLTTKMAAVLDRRQQIILLLNRRGYASYVFCPSCGWIQSCTNCTRAMVFHQATQLAMCHYCQHTELLPEHCPACKKKLLLFGFGIQRIENELTRKFPTARFARMDSDTMTTAGQFQKVFDDFSRGDVDILVGTQMVAKGLDFPRVSLVGVVSADTSLVIPDFRASERTFQLIVQVAGRAGRSDLPGEVVVQTLYAEEPAIQFAVTHDYDGFAEVETKLRKEIGYPPFSRLLRFIVRHEDGDRARKGADDLARSLKVLLRGVGVSPACTTGVPPAQPPATQVQMLGPQPCGVLKVNNQFRFQILLIYAKAGLVQKILAPRMEDICKGINAEVIADADPVMLM